MRCSNCNQDTTQQSSFCPNCGASLQASGNRSKNWSNLKIVLLVLGVVIGSCVFIGVLGMIQNGVNPREDAASIATDANTNAASSETRKAADSSNDAADAPTRSTATEPSEPEVSNVTWSEINRIYNLQSNATDAQKSALWDNYKGKVVEWEGEVADIKEGFFSGYTLHIKMNRETLTSDLMIDLDDSQKNKVLSLTKGSRIQFRGKLKTWGSILPITLEEGEIK